MDSSEAISVLGDKPIDASKVSVKAFYFQGASPFSVHLTLCQTNFFGELSKNTLHESGELHNTGLASNVYFRIGVFSSNTFMAKVRIIGSSGLLDVILDNVTTISLH